MKILGLDGLVFGVQDVSQCGRFLSDYGLRPVNYDPSGVRFVALDGTYVEIRRADDPALPARMRGNVLLRETVYGVADAPTLESIAAELRRDREVGRNEDGSVRCTDDSGFPLRFQVSVRQPFAAEPERINSPGAAPLRPVNAVGSNPEAHPSPRTLSHVVYFVPDAARAEAFYVERLGFRCSDRFVGVGPFLRPAGTLDHHTLFLIQTPAPLCGIEHFTFHFGGPTEVMVAGSRFVERGYRSFWGPGRHVLGSNWFWYFDSPLGCHIEYDADMDLHDDTWKPRAVPIGLDTSQLFLFERRGKWIPGGGVAE